MEDDGLRSWLKQAEALGELRTIEGADWDLEIGGVADLVTERGSSPRAKNEPRPASPVISAMPCASANSSPARLIVRAER